MKRPSFQFYPADWRQNAKLRRCSWAARGVWIEVLGLLHDGDEYGVLHWPLKEIIQAVGAPKKLVQELVEKGVLHGIETGPCEPMVFRPKHGRSLGAPVTLVPAQNGPVWYSPRLVSDEYIRVQRGKASQFGGDLGDAPKGGIGEGLGDAPNAVKGDGSTSSSTSTSTSKSKSKERARSTDDPPDAVHVAMLDGYGNPLPPEAFEPPTLSAAQHEQLLLAARSLQRMKLDIGSKNPTLLALMHENYTAEEVVRAAGKKLLHEAHLTTDPFVPDDLLDLLINFGTDAPELNITPNQRANLRGVRSLVPINYIAGTLRGKRRDAIAEASIPRESSRHKPSVTDNFKGKTYVGTAVDQLPPELRVAVDNLKKA